jgi:histone-lysine N-methyltransferase SETMAR
MELNSSFSALEMMVAMLEYCEVCARWVPQILTQEHKEHCMQVCQDLLNLYKAEGDSSLDRVITSDETWCHHYELESKRQSMEWQHVNSPSKKKLKMLPSVGKVICTVFWDRKGLILLDFLKPRQTINSDRYIVMLAKLKAQISRVRPEKKTTFLLQHDNPRPHTSFKTVERIVNLGWIIIPHPLYSPDLVRLLTSLCLGQ